MASSRTVPKAVLRWIRAKAAANIDTNAQLRQKGGGGRKILKRAGIGCGGLIGLFVVLIIIGAIVGPSDDNENSAENLVPNPTNRIGATVESPIRTYTTAPTSSPIPTTTPTPLPIKVGLAELFDEYDQNKVRANASLRYIKNGKTPVSTAANVSIGVLRWIRAKGTEFITPHIPTPLGQGLYPKGIVVPSDYT